MKIRYVYIFLTVILLTACGMTEIEKAKNSEESDTSVSEKIDTQQEISPQFEISLPDNADVGEEIENSNGMQWGIEVDGYQALEHYPYGNETDRKISAGWIEIYDGQYFRNGNGEPYIPWNHTNFYNYELQNNKYTYICEVEFETYLSNVCQKYGVSGEDGLSYFWCIIFIDPSAPDESISDWIFLNQSCFTKDDVLEIAKTYQPSW